MFACRGDKSAEILHPKKPKYKNKKTEVDGKVFDSKKEAQRYMELSLLQRAGQISNLETQKEYVLIPSQRESDAKGARVIERAVTYKADFVYRENGREVVEDTKGARTKDYIIKRKLMLWIYGIRIAKCSVVRVTMHIILI